MSKPLSEQVAELEATVESQEKQIVWLDTERERLAADNAELRKGSDALWEVAKHVTIPSEHIRIKDAPLGDYSAPAKDVDTSAPSLKENGENFHHYRKGTTSNGNDPRPTKTSPLGHGQARHADHRTDRRRRGGP